MTAATALSDKTGPTIRGTTSADRIRA